MRLVGGIESSSRFLLGVLDEVLDLIALACLGSL